MGLHPQRREMVDVELVEDDLAAAPGPHAAEQDVLDLVHGPDATGTAPRRPPYAPRFSRRLGLIASATVVLVTFAVVTHDTTPTGDDVVVGGAPSLISPLAETWRVAAPSGWSVAGDLLLTTTRAAHGPQVVAYDLLTGAQRWVLEPPEGTSGVQCPFGVDGPDGPWVVCRALRHVAQMHHLADGAKADPGRVLLVSAADGTVVAELPLPAGHVGLGAIEGDLVTADLALTDPAHDGPRAEMTLHLERRDLALGQPVWSTDLAFGGYTAPAALHVAVDDGMVLVTGRTTAVIDGADGAHVRVWRSADDQREASPDQVTVTPRGFGVRASPASRSGPTVWYGLDGTRLGSFVGDLAEPAVRDGTEPDVALVLSPGHLSLLGVDIAAERGLWSVDLEGGQPVVRVDGSVVVSGSRTLRSIDLRSGVELWRSPVEGLDDGQAVSDGRFVLATGSAPGRGRSISAVSLTDGSLLWRTPSPAGVRVLEVLGGHVVGVGPGVVVGLG